jgi:hypothetical protein
MSASQKDKADSQIEDYALAAPKKVSLKSAAHVLFGRRHNFHIFPRYLRRPLWRT